MTVAEYSSMEIQAMTALQQLREKGVSGDDIGILMSREVYDMARLGDNSAYAVSVENFRSVYWGYDIYVIAENSPPIFSPVIVRFLEDLDLSQFDAGTFLISESDDGILRVYTKPAQEHAFFIETEFTVYQGHQTERVTFADRICAGQERERRRFSAAPFDLRNAAPFEWGDWMAYATTRPDYLPHPTDRWTMTLGGGADGVDMEEFERQLNQVAATTQREFLGVPPRKKKAPPKKDWDERITPEDTKELDEFLNGLARKGTLESAT